MKKEKNEEITLNMKECKEAEKKEELKDEEEKNRKLYLMWEVMNIMH